MNLLVLGISGNVSQGILKAIKLSGIDCHIIGACVNLDTAGVLWCDDVISSEYASSERFTSWLSEVCHSRNIDVVLTGVEENLVAIAQNIDHLREGCGSTFVVSPYNRLLIGQDKYLTCKWLEENGFRFPSYVLSNDKDGMERLAQSVGYPLIAKPRCGKGSNGVITVANSSQLAEIAKLEDYIVQECVGTRDDEYTVGCYMDKRGNSYSPIVMRRWLSNGATWRAEVVHSDVIQNECLNICERLKPYGPLNIQLRLDSDGHVVPFELNVRFSGTTPMRANLGFCDVKAALMEFMGKDISKCFDIKDGSVYRYINEAYVFNSDGKKIIEADTTIDKR